MKNFLIYIGDAYKKMCEAVGKHGILIGVIVAMLMMMVYSTLIHPININSIVEKAFEKERQEQADATEQSIERRIKADEVIAPILEKVVEEFDLSRAMVLEKHNSVSSLSGVDFLYFSATLEVLNPNDLDLEFQCENFQRQTVSNYFGELINSFKYKDYVYVSNIENCNHPRHQIMRKFAKLGANSILFIPIKDSKNRPLVIIVFTSKSDEMPVDNIMRAVTPNLKLFKSLLVDQAKKE